MRRLLAEMVRLSDQRIPYVVATVVDATGSVPGKPGAKMLVKPDGTTLGTVGGAGLEERVKAMALAALDAGEGGLRTFDLARWKEGGLDSVCGGQVHVALEVMRPVPHLLLAGGGHVAKAIYDVAMLLDWQVSVVDDRIEYVARERFPDASGLFHAKPDWFRDADLAPYGHLYLLGYDHHVDTEILKHAAARFPGRVGVIGSRAKRASMWDRLREAGVAEDALMRVRCPIGLDIGSETPEEIAVAVVAEVIRDEKQPKEESS